MKSYPTLFSAFQDQVKARPDAIALLVETQAGTIQPFTWKQLATASSMVASELAKSLESDPQLPRRIGHASDNTLADVCIALATMSIAAVEIPIDHRLSNEEIARRWTRVAGLWVEDRSGISRRLLSLGSWEDPSAGCSHTMPSDRDSPSLILWTSGTTREPQGVTLSHRNLVGNAAAKLAAVPQTTEDIRLTILPLSHGYARTCDFGTWLLSGCTLAVTLGIAGLRRLAPRVRPTLINTVPSIARRLLNEDFDAIGLDRLRLLGCGGAAISESDFAAWKERGVTVIQGYGLTETSPVICSATPENASAGLVGEFVTGWESQIREEQLFVRGPHTMLGYWDNELATTQKIDVDGWLATGDRVERDRESGQLRILGRVDDVIVLENGCKLSPETVEQEVERIDGVAHAMLIWRGYLELWIDSTSEFDQVAIRDVIARYSGYHECAIERFRPPLQMDAGELTQKGTIRRRRIIANRKIRH